MELLLWLVLAALVLRPHAKAVGHASIAGEGNNGSQEICSEAVCCNAGDPSRAKCQQFGFCEAYRCGTESVACESWLPEEWSAWSTTCGEGRRVRIIGCQKAKAKAQCSSSKCSVETKPATTQVRNACCPSVEWEYSVWSSWTTPCGSGKRTRTAIACSSKCGGACSPETSHVTEERVELCRASESLSPERRGSEFSSSTSDSDTSLAVLIMIGVAVGLTFLSIVVIIIVKLSKKRDQDKCEMLRALAAQRALYAKKRRSCGSLSKLKGIPEDDGDVVPVNPSLLSSNKSFSANSSRNNSRTNLFSPKHSHIDSCRANIPYWEQNQKFNPLFEEESSETKSVSSSPSTIIELDGHHYHTLPRTHFKGLSASSNSWMQHLNHVNPPCS